MRPKALVRQHWLVVTAAGLAAVTLGAWADTYPSRLIRLMVAFPPGGPTDVLARIVAPRLAERPGQVVIVNNKLSAFAKAALVMWSGVVKQSGAKVE